MGFQARLWEDMVTSASKATFKGENRLSDGRAAQHTLET